MRVLIGCEYSGVVRRAFAAYGHDAWSIDLLPSEDDSPNHVKRSCFWLNGLPPLIPTDIVSGRDPRVHWTAPGANRWKERSRTLPGIADAMADQWGRLLI